MVAHVRLVQLAAIALSLLALPAFMNAPTAFVDTCAGVGLSGGTSWISCAGSCDVGNCNVGSGTDAKGNYKFCGCGTPASEPACCHLVARKRDGEQPYLDVRGLCTNTSPDCADSDGLTCQLDVNDPPQPVCRVPSQ